jgi:hypothetical protein
VRAARARATLDVLLGEIDARDPAAERMREMARRSAEARADVQEVHAAGDAELAGEVDGGLAAADVKLVDRGEIVRLEPVEILTRRPEAVEDCALERPVRVVLGHRLFRPHRLRSSCVLSWASKGGDSERLRPAGPQPRAPLP